MTFLVSQIEKGNIPSEEELLDVFEELPQKYYKEVALALLNQPQVKEQDKPKTLKNPNRDRDGLTTMDTPKPAVDKIPPATKVNPNKALTPGQLSAGAGVLGNS